MGTSWSIHSTDRRPFSGRADTTEIRAADSSDIALLSRVASRISAQSPLPEVLQDVLGFVTAVVRCDSCMIYVLEGEELVLRASKNPHSKALGRLKMKLGQGITGWVAERREPVILQRDAHQDPRFKFFHELPEDRFEAFLSVPIASGGRLVGVINVQNRAPHFYGMREVGLVATLGSLVGAEIERARLASENSNLSERLESRKIIERAKGILQRDLKLGEEDAYLSLQRESRRRRRPMREIAEAVILSDDLRRPR